MFTGIIEERGKIEKIAQRGEGVSLTILSKKVLEGTVLGDSIAVNGVCLTATSLSDNSFTVDVIKQSLNMTNLSRLKEGDLVNLERAMGANGRFGGHFVSGHIDGVGIVKNIKASSYDTVFTFSADDNIMRLLIPQGSIAIDGVSLTLSKVSEREFQVSLIPTTLRETGFGVLKIGDRVNIETDMIAKYIDRLVNKKEEGITEDFLNFHGF